MKFHPSERERRLRTDSLILDSFYYPTPFHVNSKDSGQQQQQQQEQEVKEKNPAWINKSIWTFLTKHQPEFAGPESESIIKMNKMASLLPSGGESCYENGFWFPKTEDCGPFSNPFIHQFIESDSNQDEQNNNNVSLKAHLLNISMKNSGYFHEEDEKENLAWISNIPNGISLSNLVMTGDKSPSNVLPSENLKSSSNYLNMCRQEDIVNQKEIASDSSSLDQYIQWKSKLSPWETNNINPNQIENKISLQSLSAQQQQQQQHLQRQRQQEQQQSALELELLEKLEPLIDDFNADDVIDDDDDDDIIVVVQDSNSYNCYDDDEEEDDDEELDGEDVSEKSDNADLESFLSKFPAIAAIWGQENSIEPAAVNGNPWNSSSNNNNNNENRMANRNFLPSTSIFNFQHIEDENKIIETGRMMKINSSNNNNNNNNISSSTSRKYNIVNGVLQVGSNNDYIQQHHHNNNDVDDQDSKLRLLNHSPSKSGFIKFIPLCSNQNEESSKFQQQYDKYQQGGGNKESLLKEMFNNLDLNKCDLEEQEIVQACSQPLDDSNDDLLTSWKTHFRPVGALETQEEAEVVFSPTSTLSQSQLPEFRTDYNESEYVLYKGSSTFQLRFKPCSENEKGNQTDEMSHLQTSIISCDSDYQLGSLTTPLITDYGSQYYDWLSGQYDVGSQYIDSPYVLNDYCCEEVYDDYEKFNNDNDSDYGQFQSFYYNNPSSNLNNNNNNSSNKQSKSSRRSAKAKGFKGRPCKYFFDGLCKMGNECKFSHDLITCRFWAEGSCLKGQSCPFLHCFLDAKDFENHNEMNNNYQQQFSLESESDFPALGSSKISSRVPIMSEDGSNVFSDDEGNPSMILNNNNIIKKSEEEEAGYSQPNHLNNWISLISTEKRKKKK